MKTHQNHNIYAAYIIFCLSFIIIFFNRLFLYKDLKEDIKREPNVIINNTETKPEEDSIIKCRKYFDLKNYQNASNCYKKILLEDKNNYEALYQLAYIYSSKNDCKTSAYYLKQIMDSGIETKYTPHVKKLYNYCTNKEHNNGSRPDDIDDNYFDKFTFFERWEKMPARVWVSPEVNNYINARDAFYIWQNAFYPLISFQMVNSPNEAQIIVTFDEEACRKCGAEYTDAIGCTQNEVNQKNTKEITGVKISLARTCVQNERRLTNREIYAALIHEIGHALGMDHSETEGDIMWANIRQSRQYTELSQRDINTFKKLYSAKFQ